MQTLGIYIVTKKCNLRLKESTLLEFDIELMFFEKIEDDVKMLEVVFHCPAKNQNVIQVYHHEGIQVGVHHIIHGPLKGGWSVGQTKGHYQPLILAIPGDEGGLVDILWLDFNLPIA